MSNLPNMKFKEFLENYEKMVGKKEWELMLQGAIPLRKSILKHAISTKKVPKAFHVTSFDRLQDLIRIQGTNKQISAFYKGTELRAEGAITNTEILVELEGYTVFESVEDLNTILSRSGYRWITADKVSLSPTLRVIEDKLQKRVKNYLKELPLFKNNPDIKDVYFGKDRHYSYPEMIVVFRNFTSKERANFIKWYFNEVKKLITEKNIKQILYEINSSDNRYKSDEVVLHNIKIKHIWYVKYTVYDNTVCINRGWKEDEDCVKERYGISTCKSAITHKEVQKINVYGGWTPKCRKRK